MKIPRIAKQLLIVLILLPFVIEVALRIHSPASLEYGYQDASGHFINVITGDPYLGYKYKPDAFFYWTGIEYHVPNQVNSVGFRSPNMQGEWLFTGDSFTNGLYVQQNETFVQLSSQAANKSFVNLGILGYGTDQCYWAYHYYGVNASAKTVFYVFHISDFDDNVRNDGKPVFAFTNGSLVSPPLYQRSLWDQARDFLYEKSYFMRIAYLGSEKLARLASSSTASSGLGLDSGQSQAQSSGGSRVDLGLLQEANYYLQNRTPDYTYKFGLVKAIVEKYYSEVKAANQTFVVIIIPTKIETNYGNVTSDLTNKTGISFDVSRVNEDLNALGKQDGFKVIDPLPDFQQSVKEGAKPYFQYDSHLNALGNKMLSDIIVREMNGT